MKRCLTAGVLVALFGVSAATGIAAQGEWLEQPLEQWNAPGAPVPLAPPRDPNTGCMAPVVRPPETAADEEVVAAGWWLFGSYDGGWGVLIVKGAVGFDGMCRPMGYQHFVFVDGAFAGTTSPEPMYSRTVGAGTVPPISSGDRVTATFLRYAEGDPLCCPSIPPKFVTYRINRTDRGPVLVAERVL